MATDSISDLEKISGLTTNECRSILSSPTTCFSAFSNEELDILYFVAFNHLAYHMSRIGYIQSLQEWQTKNVFIAV